MVWVKFLCLTASLLAGLLASTSPGSPTPAPAEPVPVSGPDPDTLVERIAALAEAHAALDMFSGVVLVAKDGEIIYEEAFGEANKDHEVGNRADTRFNIGSIGKTFTAVAVMQLVDRGFLRLSDPLSTFFPDLPFPEKDQITIRHLLNHASGLGDYLEHADYERVKPTLHSVDDALPLVYDERPAFPPGTDSRYSNSGFLLLGGIVEKVSGLPYAQYLAENVLNPLHMHHSGIVYEDEVLPQRSIGYTKNWDGTYTANVRMVPPPCSAGGLQTTARDLLRFDQALYGAELVSEEGKRAMFAPSDLKPTYGLGWEVKEYFGHRFVGHSGGTDGVEAYFYRFIDDGYTLITLSNYDGANGQVASGIEAILFGQPWSLPTEADAAFTLGYALQSKGRHEDAVKAFAPNIAADPPHLLSLFFSASSRNTAGFGLEEAIVELDRFIELADDQTFPPVSMAWGRKASAFEKLGRLQAAIASYLKVLESDPENSWARDQLARLGGNGTGPG